MVQPGEHCAYDVLNRVYGITAVLGTNMAQGSNIMPAVDTVTK
jgi:hypothetical protein